MSKRKPAPEPGPTLSARAYTTLKQAIIRGDLAEGSFLGADEAQRRYQIGRTPFREACNRLHHEHLIEVVPRRGFRVTELRFREVRELLEVRLLLEGLIAELATVRATDAQIDELAVLAERTGSSLEDGGADAAVQANKQFHLCLATATQNRELLDLVRAILDRTERLSYQQIKAFSGGRPAIQMLHKPIVDALRRRDAVAVRTALDRDIRSGQLLVLGVENGASEKQ